MIEMKVTVDLPGIPDALNNLARAIVESGVSSVVKSLTPAAQAPATQAPAVQAPATQAPATQAPATQAPAVQAPATQAPAAPAPAVPSPAIQAPAAPAITMNDLSKAGAALVEAGKMDAVINLLKQFGAVAITQLKEDQYASFAASLRGLGANI